MPDTPAPSRVWPAIARVADLRAELARMDMLGLPLGLAVGAAVLLHGVIAWASVELTRSARRDRRRSLPPRRQAPVTMRHLLLAALTLSACAPARPPAERVAIPPLHCTIDLPIGSEMTLDDDGAIVTTRPGARVPRHFTIHARPPGEPGELQRTLAADVSITYSLRTDPGGSGGDESLLTGALRLGDRTFAVACHDQGEWPDTANATWCLPWLATLQPSR